MVLHNIATAIGEGEPPEDKELHKFIESKRKAGVTVDFDQPDVFLPPEFENRGTTANRSAIIRDHFT